VFTSEFHEAITIMEGKRGAILSGRIGGGALVSGVRDDGLIVERERVDERLELLERIDPTG
jgi:hypothetical protein